MSAVTQARVTEGVVAGYLRDVSSRRLVATPAPCAAQADAVSSGSGRRVPGPRPRGWPRRRPG